MARRWISERDDGHGGPIARHRPAPAGEMRLEAVVKRDRSEAEPECSPKRLDSFAPLECRFRRHCRQNGSLGVVRR